MILVSHFIRSRPACLVIRHRPPVQLEPLPLPFSMPIGSTARIFCPAASALSASGRLGWRVERRGGTPSVRCRFLRVLCLSECVNSVTGVSVLDMKYIIARTTQQCSSTVFSIISSHYPRLSVSIQQDPTPVLLHRMFLVSSPNERPFIGSSPKAGGWQLSIRAKQVWQMSNELSWLGLDSMLPT